MNFFSLTIWLLSTSTFSGKIIGIHLPEFFDSKPSSEHVGQVVGKVRQTLIRAGLEFLDLRF